MLGSRLRHLFATILIFCRPLATEELWDRFRTGICDNLHHWLAIYGYSNASDDDVYDYGLFLLDRNLRSLGYSLSDFDTMPRPQPMQLDCLSWQSLHRRGARL